MSISLADFSLVVVSWKLISFCKLDAELQFIFVLFRILYVQAKYRRHDPWLNIHNIEPKYVSIRLEILSSTYLSVKSSQMDVLRQQIP